MLAKSQVERTTLADRSVGLRRHLVMALVATSLVASLVATTAEPAQAFWIDTGSTSCFQNDAVVAVGAVIGTHEVGTGGPGLMIYQIRLWTWQKGMTDWRKIADVQTIGAHVFRGLPVGTRVAPMYYYTELWAWTGLRWIRVYPQRYETHTSVFYGRLLATHSQYCWMR